MLTLAFVASAAGKQEKCKLLIAKGFTITQIDGKRKFADSETTITVSPGKHTIIRT